MRLPRHNQVRHIALDLSDELPAIVHHPVADLVVRVVLAEVAAGGDCVVGEDFG